MKLTLGITAGLAAGSWSPGSIDASDKPLVVLYYDEWAKWQQFFSVYQMERVILSRSMPVRNWVINYSFLTWSAQTCRLVPTDYGAAWQTYDKQMFPTSQWYEPGGSSVVGGSMPTMIALKQKYPSIKLVFSVGGWSTSHTFSDCVRNAPDNMIESAKDFIYFYDFDGIDMDWEYPECPLDGADPEGRAAKCGCQNEPTCKDSAGNPVTNNVAQAGDWEVYKTFIQRLRGELDNLEDRMQKKLYVTAAIGMSPNHIDGDGQTWKAALPVEWICDNDYFDWVNLMTYDFYGPWTSKTGHLTPLYTSTAPDHDDVQLSADDSIQRILKRCSRPEKLTMGLAGYGKGWANVPQAGSPQGLWQTSQNQHKDVVETKMSWGPKMTYEHGTITYWDIKYNYLNNPNCQRTFDEEAKAPTVYCSRIPATQESGQDDLANNVFISYDDGESWKAKMSYARQHGMAGAIIWAASNIGHEAHTNGNSVYTQTHDGADDLFNGLFEGWYGYKNDIAGIGASGSFSFTPVSGSELPQGKTCPYGWGDWRTMSYVANPCYDQGSVANYQNTRYPKKSGYGTQDNIGHEVILIQASSTVPPVTEPATQPATEPSTQRPTVATEPSNPNCTLPPECEDIPATEAPIPHPITTPAPIVTTPVDQSPVGDEVQECENYPFAAEWALDCPAQCAHYHTTGAVWCTTFSRLIDCVLHHAPYCKA